MGHALSAYFLSFFAYASVSGVLNASSYVSAAVSSILIGILAQNLGWNATVVFWVGFAAAGVLLCCIGAPVWSKGRKRIG